MSENEVIQKTGRIIAGAYYDYQSVRTSGINRIRDVIRENAEGLDKTKPEEKIEKEKRTFDKKYQDSNLADTLENLLDTKKLTKKEHAYLEKFLVITANAQKLENQYKNLMLKYVETEPIYTQFLQLIRGVGPVISARLIKNFGYCETYEHSSSLWKHCGLHVNDGIAPKRQKGKKIEYSPKLRSFVWNIGDSMIKQRTPFYRGLYDQFKETEAGRVYPVGELAEKFNGYKPEAIQLSKGHAHNRAKRKMEKIFLQHYWMAARTITGQTTTEPYPMQKLGHKHYYTWQQAVEANLKYCEGKVKSKEKKTK